MSKQIDTTTYSFGQEMLLVSKNHLGYPAKAYVVSREEGNYLVQMSIHFPYISGRDSYFFVHRSKLKRHWRKAEKGLQTELFSNSRKRTMVDDWREKYLISNV